jgi:hypothetical protein
MISACRNNGNGFYAFDYDTRATSGGYTHEVASGHPTTKNGNSVSAIHGSTNIAADHNDSRFEIYVGDFSITTGAFPKFFVSSKRMINDLNYIEGTVLILTTAGWGGPFNIEIHITT